MDWLKNPGTMVPMLALATTACMRNGEGRGVRSTASLGFIIALAGVLCGCDAGSKSTLGEPRTGDSEPMGAAGSAPIGSAAPSSVCAFAGSAELGAASADGSIAVAASHPFVAYGGRVDCAGASGPVLGFVGGSVHVRFRGTGLGVRLKDYGAGTPETTNYYDVTVDGGEPTLLEVSPAQERYSLASGLSDGEHQLELFKRVEAAPGGSTGAGKAEVLGFVLHGSELLPALRPERRLDFVGDSITCGYGNELETTDPDSFHYTTRPARRPGPTRRPTSRPRSTRACRPATKTCTSSRSLRSPRPTVKIGIRRFRPIARWPIS